MQAYHLKIPELDFALILFVEGDEQQVYSGELQSIDALAEILTCSVVTLRREAVHDPLGPVHDLRRWRREEDGCLLEHSGIPENATAKV